MWTVAAVGRNLRIVNEGIFGLVVGRYRRQREDALQRGRASSWRSVWGLRLAFLGACRL